MPSSTVCVCRQSTGASNQTAFSETRYAHANQCRPNAFECAPSGRLPLAQHRRTRVLRNLDPSGGKKKPPRDLSHLSMEAGKRRKRSCVYSPSESSDPLITRPLHPAPPAVPLLVDVEVIQDTPVDVGDLFTGGTTESGVGWRRPGLRPQARTTPAAP